MHEMSIAAGLMEKLLEFACAHPGRRILQVRLLLGELANIEPEQLRFCYDSIATGTELEGSRLELENLAAAVRCPHCSYCGPPKYWEDALAFAPIVTLLCPVCGETARAVQGHECAIKSVQYREGPLAE